MKSKRKVVLIGSSGQLGTDIVRIFHDKKYFEIISLTHKDVDVTNYVSARQILKELSPDIIINTAAYHNVDEVEENAERAFLVNSISQKNLAELCSEQSWKMVFISTDYVFGQDKERKTPYKENDLTGPVNVYGVSKVAGEQLTQYLCEKHFIIRVSGLFGVAGSSGKGTNFVETMVRLGKEQGEVNIVNDQTLSPTYTKNVVENLHELLKTDLYGLYHMTSKGQCSWWEFAREIFRITKMKVKCNSVDSQFFKTKATRPKYSALENSKLEKIKKNLMRSWQENLLLYLKEKGYTT